MSVHDEFCSNLASVFGVASADIRIEPTGIQVGSHVVANCLINHDLGDLLANTKVLARNDAAADIEYQGNKLTLTRLRRHDGALVEYGVIHWPDQQTWVFAGNFGSLSTPPSLDICPPLLLAVALWQPEPVEMIGFDWASLLPLWGPLACSVNPDATRERLAIAGYSARVPSGWRQPFIQLSSSPLFRLSSSATQEARDAFVSALQASDGPDTAFIRLYRVFEVEFARTTQQDIAGAPIQKVLALLRNIQSTNELDTLRKVFDRSSVLFTRFSRSDWDSLFGQGHKPRREGYQAIGKWLDSPGATCPPEKCRALIVYYVRNALVHAKLQEGDAVLLPPFSTQASASLCRLYEDCVDVVRSLLFV
jgi:hypothetical protein